MSDHPNAFCPPEALPNYDLLVTEDGKPVDSLYSERQHRLLTDVLYASWKGPGEGRPRYVTTNVGLFYSVNEPPLSPDVLISLDVALPQDPELKKNHSYFIWEFGKPPEMVVEVVANTEGEELTGKLKSYARYGIMYYVVWDPFHFLTETQLQCFSHNGRKYVPTEPWFPELELGVTVWTGEYDAMQNIWLRWCDLQGKLLLTGIEGAEAAAQAARIAKQETEGVDQDAEIAKQEAESAVRRVERLAKKLRALGIDPEKIGA